MYLAKYLATESVEVNASTTVFADAAGHNREHPITVDDRDVPERPWAIKPVRRAGAGSGVHAFPAAKSYVGWVYVRRYAYKHLSLVLCCEGFLGPASLTQRDESQRTEVQYRVSVSGALSLIFTFHPVHRVEHLRTVRLEAMLPSLHVAVEPSKIRRAEATIDIGSLAEIK